MITTAFNIKESKENDLSRAADSDWPTVYLGGSGSKHCQKCPHMPKTKISTPTFSICTATHTDDNPIFNIFGYNNICIYIDDLPGKYITAWLFQTMIMFYVAYVLVTHVNVYICYKTGIYSNWLFNILRATTFLDMLLASYSIEIFAVHPKESMLMHTLPFRYPGDSLRHLHLQFLHILQDIYAYA